MTFLTANHRKDSDAFGQAHRRGKWNIWADYIAFGVALGLLVDFLIRL